MVAEWSAIYSGSDPQNKTTNKNSKCLEFLSHLIKAKRGGGGTISKARDVDQLQWKSTWNRVPSPDRAKTKHTVKKKYNLSLNFQT